MEKLLKKFASGLGVNVNDLIKLLNDENASEDDVYQLGVDAKSVLSQTIRAEIEPEIRKTAIDKTFASTMVKSARALNKSFELGLKSDDIQNMKYDDVVALVIDKQTKMVDQSKTDGNDEFLQLKTKYAEMIDEHEKSINKIKSEYDEQLSAKDTEIQNGIIRRAINGSFKKLTYGIPKNQIPVFEDKILNEIVSRYKFDENGENLQMHDGTPALNFDNDGRFNTLDEPVALLAERYDILAKQNVDGDGGGANPDVVVGKSTKVGGFSVDL